MINRLMDLIGHGGQKTTNSSLKDDSTNTLDFGPTESQNTTEATHAPSRGGIPMPSAASAHSGPSFKNRNVGSPSAP